jgi:hypothetical protein
VPSKDETRRLFLRRTDLRKVNEQIYALSQLRLLPRGRFACECGAIGCVEILDAPLQIYARQVRYSPGRCIVAPGHITAFDRMGEHYEECWIVTADTQLAAEGDRHSVLARMTR